VLTHQSRLLDHVFTFFFEIRRVLHVCRELSFVPFRFVFSLAPVSPPSKMSAR